MGLIVTATEPCFRPNYFHVRSLTLSLSHPLTLSPSHPFISHPPASHHPPPPILVFLFPKQLHRARVGPSDHVLVPGASGGVGSAVVQLAKRRGARVTAICGVAKVEQVRVRVQG